MDEAAGCGMAEGCLEHCDESGGRRDALGNQSRSRSSRLNGVTGWGGYRSAVSSPRNRHPRPLRARHRSPRPTCCPLQGCPSEGSAATESVGVRNSTDQVAVSGFPRKREDEFLRYLDTVVAHHPDQQLFVSLDKPSVDFPGHEHPWRKRHPEVDFHSTDTHAS